MKKILSPLFVCLSLILPMSQVHAAQDHHHHAGHAQTIGEHERCQLCGMVITKYPGPKGQVLLKEGERSTSFCSTRDMFNYALQPENKRQIKQLFVHDAGIADWQNPSDSTFIDAKSAYYVYGTEKKAVMGPAVVPFSTLERAQAFAKEYGGEIYRYEQIDLQLLARQDVPHQHTPKQKHKHQHQD